jgi:hypothetical protein
MSIEIITDNKWKDLKYGHEVPEKVLNDQFDWLDEEERVGGYGFIKYRGNWYHLSEFMCIEKQHNDDDDGAFSSWHGYKSDSFFSGVVIKVSDDGEGYKIGTYICLN